MIATMNFGPHTDLELSGPSLKLITIFEKKLSKIVEKFV